MARRSILALIAPALLALAAPAGLAQAALAAGAHTTANAPVAPRVNDQESGNPINDQGSSYDYRSNITSVTPRVPGLSVEVLEFADRLLLRNHTGKTVTIYGYEGEPYARVLADGTAEQNTRAPATYLNTNFYAQVTVPASASASAPPHWEVVDRTGEFEWHDHRIHWMSPVPPARVRNKSKRTLIFDWRVPISVGASRGAIAGQLFWTPESSSAPVAVIALGVAIALGGLLLVIFVRRRRRRATGPAGGAGGSGAHGAGGGGARGPGAGGADGVGAGSREAW